MSKSSQSLESPKSLVSLRWWTALLLISAVVVVALQLTSTGGRPVLVASVVLVVVLAWFLLQVPGGRTLDDGWKGTAFLLVLVVGMGVTAYFTTWMQMMFFVAYPLTWMLSSGLKTGAAWTWALTAAATAGLAFADPEGLPRILTAGLVTGAFATVMGLWITAILGWGQERQAMHRQLIASQEQLVALTQESAAQRERERMAREIHDTLAQGFVSVITLAQATTPLLEGLAAASPEAQAASARLQQIEEVSRDNLAEARALMRAGKPPALGDTDLSRAIERLSGALQARIGLQGTITVLASVEDPEQEVALYRAATEALTNIERHSQASEYRLQLSQTPSRYTLTVSDNGIGRGSRPEGHGLTGMRERAALLGGTLDLIDADGTTIIFTIPRENND